MNVAGTLSMAVSQWLQIILITRLLGLYEVGLFSYFLALTGPLVLFSRFSLSVLVPTQRKLHYEYYIFKQYRDITNYLFVLATVIMMLFIDLDIYENICLFLFIIFKFYENKEEFIYTENIAESRIQFLACSKIYKSVVTIVLFSFTIFVSESLVLAIISLLISQMLIYYLYDRKFSYSIGKSSPELKIKHVKNIFVLGVGLSFVQVLSSMVTNIPRYIIEHFHSVEILGVFATIMYFANITNNIVIAINESVLAAFARERGRSTMLFYRSFFRLCGVFLILVIIGEIILISFGNDILVLLYGEAFMGYQNEMIMLGILLFFIVYTTLFEIALNVFNLYTHQVIMQSVTFIATIILSLLVIIPYGLIGGFIVAIFTHGILMAGQIAVLIHHWKSEGDG